MMLPENVQQKLVDEIEMFIEYAVGQEERATAVALVKKYRNSPPALAVLLEFYKVLPDAREGAVIRLAHIDSLQGITLLLVSTATHSYGAVVSEGEAHIIGEYGKEPIPDEILGYFGFEDSEEFIKKYGDIGDLPEFGANAAEALCPVCQVAAGECHLLGCPVEICPWCDGQLNKCNCRFEKLDTESVDSEEQLEALRDLLEEKGRIPYQAEQKPGYPGTSEGLDK